MRYGKHHKKQQDQSDCGVLCLSNALRAHDSYYPLEELREMSGTTKSGTTMLGLIQCAKQIGFEAEGFESSIEELKTCNDICVLHITKDRVLLHYVNCYGYSRRKEAFVIGDPAEKNLEYYSEAKLKHLWYSRAMVLLTPTKRLRHNPRPLKVYTWLMASLKEDTNIIAMAFVLGLVIATLELSTAVFSQKFIDTLLPSGEFKTVVLGLVLLLFLLLVNGFLDYIKQLFLIRQGKNYAIKLIDFFFSKLLFLPKRFFDTRRIGDLTARMNDTGKIQNVLTSFINSIIVHLLTLVVATIAIFNYNWKIGIVTIMWLPVVSGMAWRYHGRILRNQQNVMREHARNESNFIDVIRGMIAIKSTGSMRFFAERTLDIFSSYRDGIYQLGKVEIEYRLVLQTAGSVFMVSIILYGAYLAIQGDFSSGGVIAVIQLSSIVMSSSIGLTALNIELQEANTALDRMFEYTNLQKEFGIDRDGNSSGLSKINSLALNNVYFGYPGREILLHNVTFSVNLGECLGITGRIGSGKSTLIYLIQGFYSPISGGILINGCVDIRELDTGNWRKSIGVVHQESWIPNIDRIVR